MYKALYRKWRPLTFDDVISQQHITDTLKNQIKSGKTAHAYLFTGSRGTGKTTCSRILAKAVNCPNMKDGNPCLECDICREAEEGSLTDITEIDAASNNGVDDIRDLRDGAVYTPERCSYKIYIIDEVHMLSPSAFNALLKIMEEPPPYVKFILATTEIHKVPATITSRCQRYDFRRIRQEDIAARLEYIAAQEQLDLTHDGAAMIARIADGGMRDAVSLLDQCSVCAEQIDAATVSAAAGIAGRDYLYEILEAVSDGNAAGALGVTDRLYNMSKDLTRLCEELIMQLRNIMIIKAVPSAADSMLIGLPDEIKRLHDMADKTDTETVMRRLDILQQCRERMTKVLNRRVEFEMALIKLCSCAGTKAAADGSGMAEVYEKLKQLEKRIASAPAAAAAPKREEVLTANNPVQEPAPNVDIRKLRPEDMHPCDKWDAILEEFNRINPAVAGSLEGSVAAVAGNVLFITSQNRFFMELFKQPDNARSLGEAISRVMGAKFAIRARCATTTEQQKNMAEQLIKKAQNSNLETAVDNKTQ